MTTRFCDNLECENEAVGVVAISVNSYGDHLYNLCSPCEAAFAGGVQHGTFRVIAHMASSCDHKMGVSSEDGMVIPAPELFSESTDVHDRVVSRFQQYNRGELRGVAWASTKR